MKIIIAGSRTIFDYNLVVQAVKDSAFFNITEVVCGDASGVDDLGADWATNNHIPVKHFPANWDLLGKRAGIARNCEMGRYADGAIVIHNHSRGSMHMVAYMKSLGKPVHEVLT